jgi:nitrate reductase NapE component
MAMEKPIIPEVVEPDEALPADLVALRRFAYLMDEAVAIPGTRRRIGVDAAVGLIPGVGDIIGGLLSAWIVISAVRHRVSVLKVIRMLFYILLDVGIGSIPLIGDFFDFIFEENVMNLQLLMKHRNRRLPARSPREMVGFAVAIIGIVAILSIAIIGAMIALAIWIAGKR